MHGPQLDFGQAQARSTPGKPVAPSSRGSRLHHPQLIRLLGGGAS